MQGNHREEFATDDSAPDAALARAAQRGDKRAFVELVARHQAMVCGIALSVLGDFAASEDAGQEAFLTAWRKIHELREPEKLRPWLGQIARNAAKGQLRRLKPHEPLDETLNLPDKSPTPAEAAATKEEAALVRESLAQLPESYRLPLILYYREGQSVRAVAEALGLSEDAVKQRLARGREMCRDRLSGFIEAVLSSTRPSAIFTMGVAVAIGALMAPAAMAGVAFGAATASTTTVTTSGLKTFFTTVMSTSKALVLTSAVVALVCIPIGYSLHSSAPAPATNAPPAMAETPGAPPTPRNDFEDSALFAEWRALHQKLGTNAQAMPALYKAIAELADPFHKQALKAALISEWAQIAPAEGLAFFLGKGRASAEREQFFREWLAQDSQAAVTALLSVGDGWDKIARDCLKDVARAAPNRLAEVATQLPKSDSPWSLYSETEVRDAFALASESNLEAARTAAESVTGPNREQALQGVAATWAKTDLPAAIAWAKALPNGTDRDEIIRSALVGVAAVNPAAALDAVGTVPEGGSQMYFASTTGARVLSVAAQTDFDGTVAWLMSNPGRLGNQDFIGLAQAVTERLNADPASFLSDHAEDGSLKVLMPAVESALLNASSGERPAVWDWLQTQPEDANTSALRKRVLASAAWQDPDFAIQLVDQLPNSPQGDLEVQTMATNLFNGGNMLSRFESLYPQAPERLQTPLVQAAFHWLNDSGLGDPQVWVQRLALLPAGDQTQGAAKLGRAWGEQYPDDAVAWASSLPQGDAQNAAVAAIAAGWAAKDATGAADWVSSLPTGSERDQSAQALAAALATKSPTQAWNWALSIGNETERYDAAANVVQAMAANDAPTARQWIDSGPFAPEAKLKLQALLTPTAAPK